MPLKTPQIAQRLSGVSESATLKLNAMVQALKAQGRDIVNLTAGEPDFNVPESAKAAAIDAVNRNQSKYTAVGGLPDLKKLVADKTNAQQPALASRPWNAGDVLVTNGAKQALYDFFQAVLDPQDEVIVPSPYWLSYPEMVKLADGTPKIVTTTFESGFKMTPAQLKAALSPKVKAVIFNSPSNPTGSMYTRAELAALGKVLLETPGAENVWVVSDEIYDEINFGDVPFCSFLDAAPGLRDRCVTVNGLSKSAAMTGWRVGWSVGPENVTQAMATLQGQSTSGICAITQWAAIAALKLPPAFFTQQADIFRKKRDLVLDILRKGSKMKIRPPEGAFYAFVGVRDCLLSGEDTFGFAERLLQEAGVAVVPGGPFGEKDFVRISFATDEASLKKGCERLLEFTSRA